MNNKGRIVVFISMMTAVMIVLITLVIQVVILSAAKSKNVIATRLSISKPATTATYLSIIIFSFLIRLRAERARLIWRNGWNRHIRKNLARSTRMCGHQSRI